MAFWGIEVRPGKPYTHIYDTSRGRLRICQATLGNGKSTSKTVVQCNVGNKSPVLLCNLIPNVSETCRLELEFQENDEVIFSVLGQRSVHLSGYYIGSSRNLGGDETDSYGEDIAGIDTSGSYSSYSSESEYESDFIDDNDIEMFPSSPRRKSGVVIEEIVEDDKPPNGNANRRRLKKKHQLSDSEDGDVGSQRQLVVKSNSSTILESEDEDGFPISFSSRRKNVVKESEGKAKSDEKMVDEDKKRKIDAISQDTGSTREPSQPCDSSLPTEMGAEDSGKSKKKKKAKDGKPLETGSKAEERVSGEPNKDQDDKENGKDVQIREEKVETKGKDLPVGVEADGPANDGKPKKVKERVKKGKKSEERTKEGAKENPTEAINIDNMDQDPPISSEPEKLPADGEVVGSSVTSDTAQQTSSKLKKKNKKRMTKDDNLQEKDGAEVVGKDAGDENDSKLKQSVDVGKTVEVSELPNDKGGPDVEADTPVKKKKKKNKSKNKDSAPNHEPEAQGKTELVKGKTEPKAEASPPKTRTFGNGLTIEEVSMGKPDGKRASPGNKVLVNYIGKLKNGIIFDSNVGKRPFKFRLGVGEVIKGWDIGVEGMRVGDKRRLTIPPSFGYGERGVAKIPANSWLVFDVELVAVH